MHSMGTVCAAWAEMDGIGSVYHFRIRLSCVCKTSDKVTGAMRCVVVLLAQVREKANLHRAWLAADRNIAGVVRCYL